MHSTAQNSWVFRKDLQGLRALAIFLVIFAHAGIPPFSGGYIGVDIFFVLSGYLISGLLFRELNQTGKIQLTEFYARRLKRLFPALFTVIILTVSIASLLLSNNEARGLLASTPYAATWTSNLFFAFRSYDYFDESAVRDLFLHTWSLGVEEQFYLIWPLLLLGLLIFHRKQGNHADIRKLFTPLMILLLLGFATNLLVAALSTSMAFYLMPTRIWQFTLGGLVYLWTSTRQNEITTTPIPAQTGKLILWTGLLFVLVSSIILKENPDYPALAVLAPSLGAALIIGIGALTPQTTMLSHPWMNWIGDRAYSLYLWHWPVLKIAAAMGYTNSVLELAAQFLLIVVLADCTFRCIERPLWKRTSNAREYRLVMLASLLFMLMLVLAWNHLEKKLTPPVDITALPLSQRMNSDMPEIYSMGCDSFTSSATLEPCIFADKQYTKTVVLLGDSIGVQWFSAIKTNYPAPEWRLIVLTKSSCAILDETYKRRDQEYYSVCFEWRETALKYIKKIQPDVIFIGSVATYGFTESQWLEGTDRYLERLSQDASKVYIIMGTPFLPFDGPGCINRIANQDVHVPNEACQANLPHDTLDKVARALGNAAKRHSNVYFIDPASLVCPDGVCSALNASGVGVFRDSQHLTDSFVRSIASDFGDLINQATDEKPSN